MVLDNRQSKESRPLVTAEKAKLAALNTQLTYLGSERLMLPSRVIYCSHSVRACTQSGHMLMFLKQQSQSCFNSAGPHNMCSSKQWYMQCTMVTQVMQARSGVCEGVIWLFAQISPQCGGGGGLVAG